MPSSRNFSAAASASSTFSPGMNLRTARFENHSLGMLRRIQGLLAIQRRNRRMAANVSDMDLGLRGARALVTGGSAGLGAAVARTLSAEGARVAVAARAGDRLDATVAALNNGLAIPTDLATTDGPALAVANAVEQLGGLDALLISMGGPPPGKFDELDDAAWQKALDGTLWSTLHTLRAALPHLAKSEHGSIC